MLPAILAKIGLPALLDLLGQGLEKVDNPVAKTAASAVREASGALSAGSVTPEQMAEANRHIETLEKMDADAQTAQLTQINESLRTESQSSDWYVRRMRPTFGYLMAITWAVQMLSLAWVIVNDPAQAGAVLQAMDSLSLIWTVGLSVLGIYVYKRSEEKRRN